MRKTTKWIGYLFVFTLVLFLLGACSNDASGGDTSNNTDGDTNDNATVESDTSKPIELSLLDYLGDEGSRPEALKKVIADFESAYPNVTINRETVPFGEMDRRVLQAAASQQIPDIMVPNLISMETLHSAFVPMTDYLPTEFFEQFYEGNVEGGTIDGTVYGIQVMGANNVALNYNKTHFEEAGIEPPTTWEELTAAAETLTQSGRYGLAVSAINTTEALWQFLPFFWSNGAELEEVNSPEGIQALEYLNSFIENGTMSKEVVNWNQGAVLDQFIAGNASMMINGPWNTTALDESGIDYGVVKVPVREEGMNPIVAIGGEVWGLGKTGDEEKTKMAAEFIKFLTADEQRSIELSNAWGYLPSIQSVTTKFNELYPDLKPYAEQMETARPMYSPKGYSKVDAIMQVAIQSVITGGVTPEEALNKAAQEISDLE